jgi:pyruvate,water dikinase
VSNSSENMVFPLPTSLEVAPGTESVQASYPYYMQFSPEDDKRFWFYNSMHFPEPMTAFDMVTAEAAYCALGASNTRVFSLPTTLGIDFRIINGRVYIGGNGVTDPDEIAKRTEEFQKRAFYYYDNWETLYADWKQKMLKLIAEAEALPSLDLPEFEPLENVLAAKGIASNHYILDTYHKTMSGYFQMWHHHFEMLLLGYGAYMVFFDFCKRAFPEITDQTIARMVAGFEAEIFRPDDEVKGLAHKAVELGLDHLFTEGASVDALLAAVGAEGEAGAQWLQCLEEARHPWFNINVGDGFYHYHRSWNDDLSLAFAGLHGYIQKIKAGESLDRPIEQLKSDRQDIIEGYREMLSSDDERAAYDQMIELACTAFPYVEGHKFYCEHWYTNLFFNKIREFGQMFVDYGLLHDVEDIFHLNRFEVEQGITDVMVSWSTGSPARGAKHFQALIDERKKAIEVWATLDAAPALGPVPDIIDDPAIVMLWGITRENLDAWMKGDADDTNEILGFAASSGVVEGTARVIKSVNEIDRLQQGDILVCQVTNPTWAPIFQKISAAVSDIGGSMSHAAIVAREYGLPAVVGTGKATVKIADGQRIRVDGARGIVTLL